MELSIMNNKEKLLVNKELVKKPQVGIPCVLSPHAEVERLATLRRLDTEARIAEATVRHSPDKLTRKRLRSQGPSPDQPGVICSDRSS